jgi:hypothetical protein
MLLMTIPSKIRPATLDLFPNELKARPQWVLWRLEAPADDPTPKPTKIPFQVGGKKASVNKPETWTTFGEVVAHQDGYDGVGFVISEESEIFFVDLDKCVNPETGVISAWAEGILDQLNSYAELSPSGTGLHVWGKGKLPDGRRKVGNLEMYTQGRFGTVTGWKLDGTPSTVQECDLAPLHKRMEAGAFDFSKPAPEPAHHTVSVIDKFSYLQAGRWTECSYPSQSEGDMALCGYLAEGLETAAEIDAAFRETGMMREKWDSNRGNSTYGADTIAKVLASRQKNIPRAALASILRPADIPDPRSLSSQPVRCVVERLIPENQVTLVAGEAGSGKTWFAMMMAKALIRGEQFLGRETIACGSVTYFDRENPLAVVKERMVAIFGELDEYEETHYRHWGLWWEGGPPGFDSELYTKFAVPGAVLIFDSLGRFHLSDENNPTAMMRVFAHLRQLQALGATVIVLHHRPKNLESAGYRGSTEIAAGCDVLYSFSKENEDLRTLKQVKARTALDESITFRVDWDLPALIPAENTQVTKRREHCALISNILHGHAEGVKQAAIIAQMEPHGVSRTQTQRYLDSNEGRLWISKGGGHGVPRTYHARIVVNR